MTDEKTQPIFEIRKADADYKPFPAFSEWTNQIQVDTVRWERYSGRLSDLRTNGASDSDFAKVKEAIEIAAAIDTGAIEGLYETDRGFTYSVAFEAAVWQSAVESEKGDAVRAMIESHLEAFEFVLDFATKETPIASAWIRQLHTEICKEQETYQAFTEVGIQNLPLPKGRYKTLPNHVRTQEDEIHSYAPVDLVSDEMMRLCDELNTKEFLESHPAVQAGYAHYCFVSIHPFADGNGRVARALASVYFYRAYSIPLLIFADSRGKYFEALAAADGGKYFAFVDFISDIGLSSIQLFADSLETGSITASDETIGKIENLYVTKGGYSHEEVDRAAIALVKAFQEECKVQLAELIQTDKIKPNISTNGGEARKCNPGYRWPLRGVAGSGFSLNTPAPAHTTVSHKYNVEVPIDCDQGDDIILRDGQGNIYFEARATDLIPLQTATLLMRIKLKVRQSIQSALQQLLSDARLKIGK